MTFEYAKQRLTEKQKLRIQTRHKVSIERHGYEPQALFWSNREIQHIRFKKLMEILPSLEVLSAKQWSLLDVGCGFADLYDFLQDLDYAPNYSGLDISQDMVNAANAMHKHIEVNQGELVDFNYSENQFDYVFLSGALNEVVETELEGNAQQQGAYAKSVIFEMYRICKQGVAFNLLDKRHSWVASRTDLQAFTPVEIVGFCKGFASQVRLVEGYLENDFTVHLYKDRK